MSARPHPKVQALRDALLAALRDADTPLTTHEVIACLFEDGQRAPYRHYSLVYSNLRALDRLGLVTWRAWEEGTRATLWSAVAQPVEDLSALEAMWASS